MLYEINEVAKITGKSVQQLRYLIDRGFVRFRKKDGVFVTEEGLQEAKNYQKRAYKRKKTYTGPEL